MNWLLVSRLAYAAVRVPVTVQRCRFVRRAGSSVEGDVHE